MSILVDLENLPTSDNATLVDGTPLGAGSFDLLSCAAVCTVIFGIKRKGTFIPSAGTAATPPPRPNGPR